MSLCVWITWVATDFELKFHVSGPKTQIFTERPDIQGLGLSVTVCIIDCHGGCKLQALADVDLMM